MKKQTILSLAVCALSFGAIAGAVSAQRAEETKAATNVAFYFKDATWWNKDDACVQVWDGSSNRMMERVEEGTVNVWKLELDQDSVTTFYVKRVNAGGADWGAEVTLNMSAWSAAKPMYDISESSEAWKPSAPTGEWKAYEEPTPSTKYDVTRWIVTDSHKAGSPEENIKVTENTDIPAFNPHYGKVFGGWFTDEECTTPAGKVTANVTVYGKVTSAPTETYHFDVSAVTELATPNYHTWDENGNKAEWPGEAATGVSDGKFDLTLPTTADGVIIVNAAGTKQTVDIKDLDPDYTYQVLNETVAEGTDAGKYKVNPVYNQPLPVLEKVAGKIGTTDLVFSASTKGPGDTWDAQFEATLTDASADDVLTFTYDSAAITSIDITGENNNVKLDSEQLKIVKGFEGSKKLYLKSTGGAWSLWVEGNEPEPIADGYYLVGTHNSWAINDGSKSGTPSDDNLGEWQDVVLAAGSELKVVGVESSVETWKGYDQTVEGCRSLFTKNETEGSSYNNIVITAAGTYDVYVNKDGNIWISKEAVVPTLDKVAGKIGTTDLTFSASEKEGEETWDAQFYATFSGAAGDELTFTYNSAAINPTLDGGENNVELVETKIKLIDAVENKKLYLKSTAGVWSLWVEGKKIVEDGYYLVGDFNEWAFNAGSKSGTPTEGNLAEWQDVALTAGQEFKVSSVASNVKSWMGYDETGEGCRSLIAKNTEEGPSNNNIIINANGTYDIFVNSEGKIWINKEEVEPVYAGKVGTTDIALSAATVDPEYDGEDCLKKFEGIITCEDGAQLSFTKDGVAITTNIGPIETANLSNDLKVVKGGAGLVVQVKIYASWVGIWVSQPADADLAAVREFVNTYITAQGAEDYTQIPEADRNAKCVSKYQAAKAAFDALSEAQQTLFNTEDEFTNPRAILAEWKAVVDAQSGVKSIARMSNPNMVTVTVVGSILAVGAIAAIGMIIFAKKRKAE